MALQRIYYLVGYTGESVKHGGVQRTNQTRADIFKDFGDETEVVDIRAFTKADLLISTVFLPLVLYRLRTYPISIRGWFKACVVYRTLRRFLRQKDTHVFFLEGWDDLYLLAGLLIKESRGRYIAFPQNIDGMRPGMTTRCFRSLWDRFGAEVSVYRGAIVNLVICDFDRAIIETFSANARVYPFYPVEEKLKSLQLVKSARRSVSSNEVLIFGTVGNPPTGVAMKSLLHQASVSNLGKYRLIVAGFGTEVFSGYNSAEITILGSISEDRFGELLGTVRCVIAPSLQTTGFLTRLVDMNLAGVPVVMFGRYLQANNMEDYGIYFAKTIGDLPQVLDQVGSPRKEFDRPRLKDVLGEGWAGERVN